MPPAIPAVLAFEQAHWHAQAAYLVSALPSLIVALTNYPKTAGALSWLLRILNAVSVLSHKDSPGTLKLPLANSRPPLALGTPVLTKVSATPLAGLLLLALIPMHAGCATLSWSSSVLTAGPTAAPIEEVSRKNPVPAVAAGYQATLGLGQYAWQGHEWDAIDLSLLALGGAILPGSGPVGALQVGGGIGTLNGIVGVAVLSTPYAADGSGWAQGGAPGTTFGLIFNVQALTAYLGAPSGATEARPRLPRGGL